MLKLEYKPYILDFKFEAGTSRGVMTSHEILYIKIYDADNPSIVGFGEIAPLPGLSEEQYKDVQEQVKLIQEKIGSFSLPENRGECFDLAFKLSSQDFSSIIFGLETALLDLWNGGYRQIFKVPFVENHKGIPINGLIWMAGKEEMKVQVDQKIAQGFECIKMKVGALNFDEELEVIKYIRSLYDGVLRLDANGAFKNNEALKKLQDLEAYDIHSIEQPIIPRQLEAMQLICRKSKVPIALDEELVGVTDKSHRVELLRFLRPAFIILKPTLHGGMASCMEWITIANQMEIGYWITSALESNVGLNAIAQFADFVNASGHQGLGTGTLYNNNIASPLYIKSGSLYYDSEVEWDSIF